MKLLNILWLLLLAISGVIFLFPETAVAPYRESLAEAICGGLCAGACIGRFISEIFIELTK